MTELNYTAWTNVVKFYRDAGYTERQFSSMETNLLLATSAPTTILTSKENAYSLVISLFPNNSIQVGKIKTADLKAKSEEWESAATTRKAANLIMPTSFSITAQQMPKEPDKLKAILTESSAQKDIQLTVAVAPKKTVALQ